jgi:hypothetical protein
MKGKVFKLEGTWWAFSRSGYAAHVAQSFESWEEAVSCALADPMRKWNE